MTSCTACNCLQSLGGATVVSVVINGGPGSSMRNALMIEARSLLVIINLIIVCAIM